MIGMDKVLLASRGSAGGPVAEGVSFDGVSDYLSRSSDLVGNTDSKTFTFSCWVYVTKSSPPVPRRLYESYQTFSGLRVGLSNKSGLGNELEVIGYDSGGTARLSFSLPNKSYTVDQWNHVLISVGLGSTGTRKVFVNDVDVTSNVTWSIYNTLFDLDFTKNGHYVARQGNTASGYLHGRLSHLYLDYTYRDLSIEANRRLFITADGKPADGLANLNPILYLPMRDADTAHINEGTGGDFVPNGVLDTAQRGANQDNCVASKFDGVDDYLSRTSIGAADGKLFTLSFTVEHEVTTEQRVFDINSGTSFANSKFGVSLSPSGTLQNITISGYINNSTLALSVRLGQTVINKNDHVSISVDMSNSSACRVIVNGVSVTPTIYTLTDTALQFSAATSNNVCKSYNAVYFYGSLGELYFDTNYIDLATDNPFWDTDLNKPKPVRQVLEETGNTPLIAMPISADNPGKNYGTGGDFTLNGGGLVGARGASEFISRSVSCIGVGNYLQRNTVLNSAVNSKKISLAVTWRSNIANTQVLVYFGDDPLTSNRLTFQIIGYQFDISARNSSGTQILQGNGVPTYSNGQQHIALVSFDLTNPLNRHTYINGVASATTYLTYTNDFIDLTSSTFAKCAIGASTGGATTPNGYVGICYLTTDYIDFSQESNRNLFVDQATGYPNDLSEKISQGLIPEPLIYLPFDEPDNLGKNLGTGGDFSVVGNVAQGSDFAL